MKLLNVFASNVAWGKVTQLRMNPRMAYAILKYARLVASEYEIVEKSRIALIHELTNTKEGENVSITPGTTVHDDYVKRFSGILDVEAELNPSVLKLDDLLSAISEDQTNSLSALDIGALEPFFFA